jgi:hypothetical protein
MMVEAQIREALKVLLEPLPGLRDHVTFDAEDIPEALNGHWVCVSCGDEIIEQLTMGNPTTGAKQAHTLEVFVDVFYMTPKLGLLEAEKLVEVIVPAVFTDRTLGGLVKSFVAVGKRRERNLEGGPVARIRLQCQTVFQTFDRDPTRSV